MYSIVDASHSSAAEVTGTEILAYFNQLYMQEREENERKQKEKACEFYWNSNFISSTLNSPYKVRMWDQNGRKRTTLELIIMLAIVTIQNESGKWDSKSKGTAKEKEEMRPIYAHRDWKVQNMVDTLRIAREESVENLVQLQECLDKAGKETSISKAEVRRLTAAKNRMDVLLEAIEDYDEVKDICEEINGMPEGTQKTEMQRKYAAEIAEYKKCKSVMYQHEVSSQAEIEDFLVRYEQIQKKVPLAEEQAEKCKERYRRLSKLRYNLQLAENKQYCYGPEYEKTTQPAGKNHRNIQR